MRVGEGSFVGVVGQVGSGKSTLLSAILGETDKLSGAVYVQVFIYYVLVVKVDILNS